MVSLLFKDVLYLWVRIPYNLRHAFPTLFTVAAHLFWCFYLDLSWKRMKEEKCWLEDFSVVSSLFKDVLISMGSL